MNNKMCARTVICFILVLCLFLVCSVRITMIISEPKYAEVSNSTGSISVNVSKARGNIFDCNGVSLTTHGVQNVAVATPNPQVIMYLSSVLKSEQKETVLETLNKGKPAIIKVDEPLNCGGIINLEIPIRESKNKICDHLLGYTDSSLNGISGIEKLFNETLESNNNISVRYFCDATGKVLKGLEPEIELQEKVLNSGIMLTIDKNVQTVAEKAAEKIEKGAVIISEAGTGKIRAMVSRPDFDSTNISDYLENDNSPFVNRCLMAYNVGSAFKPCVAAAGIESGYTSFSNNCTGNLSFENITFNCHNRSGHGVLNLKDALSFSCNTFFYNYAFLIGGEKIYNTASLFGFGYKKTLCKGLTTLNESITNRSSLTNSSSALANISIGQGELLASPVTMLSLYEAIACEGVYYKQSIIEGTVEQGVLTKTYNQEKPTRALSKETANTLKEYLIKVVESGTGTKAKVDSISVAGKTATAQTGKKDKNGVGIEHSWFCGFFPTEEPKYIVCVIIEDAKQDGVTGAEVFRQIAEAIY